MIYENMLVIPVYHSRLVFSKLVLEEFLRYKPECVAVELPGDLKDKVIEAIKRLPYLSIIGYRNTENIPEAHIIKTPVDNEKVKDDENFGDGNESYDVVMIPEYMFIPVHPADPMVEAVRLALEYGKDIAFIDTIIDDYEPKSYHLPDEEVIELINDFDKFEQLVLSNMPLSAVGEIDYERELVMATRLNQLMKKHERIMFVVGFAHWNRIKQFLDEKRFVEIVENNFHEDQQIFNVDVLSADLIMDEMPYLEYLYEMWRRYILKKTDPLDEIFIRDLSMRKFEFFSITEKQQEQKERNNSNLKSDLIAESKNFDDKWLRVLEDITRLEMKFIIKKFNRRTCLSLIFLCSNHIYKDYYLRAKIPSKILRAMMQYLRNWAIIDEKLFPDLYKTCMTAKNFINDEYASIVLDIARSYPFIDNSGKYPTVSHNAEDNVIGPNKIFLKNRLYPMKKSWIKIPIKKRMKERFPGEWKSIWNQSPLSLCSYPPEDIMEENFFNHLRLKTMSILEQRNVKIHEFKSSLLDGVDFRETLRKIAIGKLYVKEITPIVGKAGSVVIVFNKDTVNRFNYKVTWWAEHLGESDMAFYSTIPEDNLIGPGIARVEVGGLVSIYPPRQIPDVWQFFEESQDDFDKDEILLLTAIYFSQERFIPYLAKEPPLKKMEDIASSFKKVIIHIPIWNLSRETIESIKYIHILSDKKVREYASKYIFL
ncbi:MAG: hypothetical protein ACTSWN_12615 [Promethearchaeota archaeon]